MGLIQTQKRITIDEVYQKVDDANIFSHYFGNFSFRKVYPSVFRKDSNPSTGFYVNKNGNIIYNDISTGEKLNAFAFVAKKYGINYGEAITKVACDFGIVPCKGIIPITPKEFKKGLDLTNELKKETNIEITYDKWNVDSLAYWDSFSITKEELEANEVYPIRTLRINDVFIPNIRANLRFAYILNYKGKCYKKIYEPFAPKQYKWFNSVPLYLPYGYDTLKYQTDTLILQKSQKDRLITLKFHPDCIALQNESPAALRDTTLSFLKRRYKRIICIFDNDSRGLEACEEYKERGCETYHLPVEWLEQGIKDFGDLVKNKNLNEVEQWIKDIM